MCVAQIVRSILGDENITIKTVKQKCADNMYLLYIYIACCACLFISDLFLSVSFREVLSRRLRSETADWLAAGVQCVRRVVVDMCLCTWNFAMCNVHIRSEENERLTRITI